MTTGQQPACLKTLETEWAGALCFADKDSCVNVFEMEAWGLINSSHVQSEYRLRPMWKHIKVHFNPDRCVKKR